MIITITELQERLSRCEREISELVLHGEEHHLDGNNRLTRLLAERCDTLNRLFDLHKTMEDVQRVEQKNKQMADNEQIIFDEHCEIYQRQHRIDVPFCLYTKLEIRCGNKIQPMDDDAYYGSRWADMIPILSNNIHTLYSCRTYPIDDRHTPYSDGWIWSGRIHGSPQFNHIKICYTFWVLCERLNYSIPDLLRINQFGYSHVASFNNDIFI